jgi:hypothetical protein
MNGAYSMSFTLFVRSIARAIVRPAMLAGVIMGASASVGAQMVLGLTATGQPATVTLTGQNASVPGFRSALWGMTPQQVRAAVAKDFAGARTTALVADRVTGNRALIAPMTSLAPGPGPAAISYVFSATSGRLEHINLDWTVHNPTVAQRSAILAGGTTVVAGFAGNYWKLGSVMRGVVVQRDLIVLFAGADEQGGKVDVRVGGVPYTMSTARAEPVPTGVATLHVGFSAPGATNGGVTLAPGAF